MEEKPKINEGKFGEKILNFAFNRFGLFFFYIAASVHYNRLPEDMYIDFLSFGKSILLLLGVTFFGCFFGVPNTGSFKDNFIFWLGITSAFGVFIIFSI